MTTVPSGVVTFLCTDIEGSTRRWESEPDAMRTALAAHDEVLRQAIDARGGWQFKHTGDGVWAAFASPRAAVEAATDAERLLALPVRMGIATGEAEQRGDDYFGPALNRAARVMAAGHGGQILVASSTVSLVDGLEFLDLGARRLRDLSEPLSLFQVLAEGLRVEFPPLQTMDTVPGNLPAQATSFVGRAEQVAAVSEALRTHRLVTLVGVGGVGKTRLALHAAAEVSGEYRDGAWLVELAPILDGAELTESVAAVFAVVRRKPTAAGATASPSRSEPANSCCSSTTANTCSTRPARSSRRSSRTVPTSPSWQRVERPSASEAKRYGKSRRSTSDLIRPHRHCSSNEPASSCPISSPTARPWRRSVADSTASRWRSSSPPRACRSMSPIQIRDRLDERFRLLTGSRRSLERHQTLRHAVQWSYDLLGESEQRVLQRAAVFAGGFTLAAATAVCGRDDGEIDEMAMLDVLDSIVRKSLVQVERSEADVRYTMLETIRQFAEERLTESADGERARDADSLFFADQAEAFFELFRGPQEALMYRFVDDEMANLRAAFRWAVDHDRADPAIRIAAYAHAAARFRLRTETFGWAAEVVDVARRIEHAQLPLLLTMATDSAWALGLLEDAKRYGHEAIACADDPRFDPLVWAYGDLAQIALFEGDISGSVELAHRGAIHPADRRDRLNLAALLAISGIVGQHLPEEEFVAAISEINEAGFPLAIAFGLAGRATRAVDTDPAAAVEVFQSLIDLLESGGNRLYEQMMRSQLVNLLANVDDPDLRLAGFVDTVNAWRINGDTLLAAGIGQLVVLLVRLGHIHGAVQLYGAATRSVRLDALVPELEPTMTVARDAIGGDAFIRARDAGAALSYQTAGDLACELIARARADLASDR